MNLPSVYTQSVEGLENFEFSGDDFRVVQHSLDTIENGTGDPAKNLPDAEEHNTHSEDAMSDIKSNKPDTGMTAEELAAFMSTSPVRQDEAREFDKFRDPDYKPAQCLPWCVPMKCKSLIGPDVIHMGETMTFRRALEDGESYTLAATPTRLEERGTGYTTEKYISLDINTNDEFVVGLSVDLDDLETMADWLNHVYETTAPLR